MRIISRTVWILSLVSLFTDMASEMLYPVMPVYLKEIGFSVMLIGVLEGVAEATAGLSKSYFGRLSDLSGKRVPFVRIGYLLSAVSKPMMAMFVYPLWVFLARTADRLGIQGTLLHRLWTRAACDRAYLPDKRKEAANGNRLKPGRPAQRAPQSSFALKPVDRIGVSRAN